MKNLEARMKNSQSFLGIFWREQTTVEQVVSSFDSIPVPVELVQFVDQPDFRDQEEQGVGKFLKFKQISSKIMISDRSS